MSSTSFSRPCDGQHRQIAWRGSGAADLNLHCCAVPPRPGRALGPLFSIMTSRSVPPDAPDTAVATAAAAAAAVAAAPAGAEVASSPAVAAVAAAAVAVDAVRPATDMK